MEKITLSDFPTRFSIQDDRGDILEATVLKDKHGNCLFDTPIGQRMLMPVGSYIHVLYWAGLVFICQRNYGHLFLSVEQNNAKN